MSLLHLTLRQLQVFAAIADQGSTAAAAGKIALSQSATSAALNDLERSLGLSLFDRVGKRLILNASGRMLLPQVQALLDGATTIEHWAREDSVHLGALRIGASTTIGSYVLPAVLAGYRSSLRVPFPSAPQPQVVIANTAAIARGVAAFELDFGLIEGPSDVADLVMTPWLEDELVIVAGARDPIVLAAEEGQVSLQALREASWLLREPGSGTREIILQALMPRLHNLNPGIEFGNAEAIKRAVAGGLGITCLSRWAVEDMIESGRLVPLVTPLPKLVRRFHLVLHKQKKLSPGLQRLIDYMMGYTVGAAPVD